MALSSTTSRRSPIAAGVVLGAAVGLVGTSFGLFAVTSGLSTPQACALSLLTFTGASQFALVSAVAAGGTPIAAVGSALLLGARNGVYGLAMSRVITGSLPRRLVAAQLVLDESTALAMAQPERSDQQRAFWSAGISVFVCWNLGTVIGALVGSKIGSPDAWGLDAEFPNNRAWSPRHVGWIR